MKKIITWLEENLEPTLIVLSVTVMTALVFIEILLRPFKMSISWSGEMARHLFVWAIYLGVSYAIRGDRHIRVTLLIDRLPGRGRAFFIMLSDIIFAFYSTLVIYYGYKVCARSIELGQIAPAMEIPIATLYFSVVLSSTLCLVRLLPNIKKQACIFLNGTSSKNRCYEKKIDSNLPEKVKS